MRPICIKSMELSGNGFSARPGRYTDSGRKRSGGNDQIVHLARATMQAEVTHTRSPERIVGSGCGPRRKWTLSSGQVYLRQFAPPNYYSPTIIILARELRRCAQHCVCARHGGGWMSNSSTKAHSLPSLAYNVVHLAGGITYLFAALSFACGRRPRGISATGAVSGVYFRFLSSIALGGNSNSFNQLLKVKL